MNFKTEEEFRMPTHPTRTERPYEAKPVCSLYEKCNGCVYPQSGFVCWSRDAPCLKDRMEKISDRRKKL